jgi:hypothetical protein
VGVLTAWGSNNAALCIDSELVGTVPSLVLDGGTNQRIIGCVQTLGWVSNKSEDGVIAGNLLESEWLESEELLAYGCKVSSTVGHFNITVDWSDSLGCQGCICDENLHWQGFAGNWVGFVNAGFRV